MQKKKINNLPYIFCKKKNQCFMNGRQLFSSAESSLIDYIQSPEPSFLLTS